MLKESVFLVIDDNSIDRMIALSMLKKCLDGPETHMVESSEEAIEWLKTNQESRVKPLIILLDMYMPGVDGFGFLDEYELLPDHLKSNTDIFMLSSAQDDDRTRITKQYNYVKGILEKPLNIDNLEEAIQ